MLIVGLTGGIGSGKSTVASLFAEKGVPIIDADVVAREVTTIDKPALASIVKHFGQEIVTLDGSLDRARLRQIIFNNPKQRLWLENLLHPLIRDEMQKKINALTTPYCIAVIPLLLEVEFYAFINRILVIDTPEATQIDRAMARDNSSREDIEAILKTQASRQDRKARAHDIITNIGNDTAKLLPQIEKLHALYLELAKTKQ